MSGECTAAAGDSLRAKLTVTIHLLWNVIDNNKFWNFGNFIAKLFPNLFQSFSISEHKQLVAVNEIIGKYTNNRSKHKPTGDNIYRKVSDKCYHKGIRVVEQQ